MRYARKITVIVLSLIMIAAIAVGLSVIFSVKNVNVTLEHYGSEEFADEKIELFKGRISNKVLGSLLGFVSDRTISEAVSDEDYSFVRSEKKYPSTLNVTIRQKMGVFAVNGENGYEVYDIDGELVKSGAEESNNPVDGAPNVIVTGTENADDVRAVAGVCKIFKEKFSSLRSTVAKVELVKSEHASQKDKLLIFLRCGLKIDLSDYGEATEQKIGKAFEKYGQLSGEQKLSGGIYFYLSAEGLQAGYNKDA